jgi:hypothetical protein
MDTKEVHWNFHFTKMVTNEKEKQFFNNTAFVINQPCGLQIYLYESG